MSETPTETRMRLCLEDVLRGRVPLFDGVDVGEGVRRRVDLGHDHADRFAD